MPTLWSRPPAAAMRRQSPANSAATASIAHGAEELNCKNSLFYGALKDGMAFAPISESWNPRIRGILLEFCHVVCPWRRVDRLRRHQVADVI
jgi:hypothetical protein